MAWNAWPYLLPYVGSFAISAGVAVSAWLRRETRGARAYSLVALAQASWTFGYIFELLNQTLDGKIFWDNFQFIGGGAWIVAFLAFSLDYTGRRMPRPRLAWPLLAALPVIVPVLAYTDPLHHLIRASAVLEPGEMFGELTYPLSPVVLAWGYYGYAVFLYAMASLIRGGLSGLFRTQVALIVLGNLIPLAGTLVILFGLTLSFHRDISPLTFALGNVLVWVGLFRFRLFDLVPVARERVIEGLRDAVVVLDLHNRVIDLNPAAARYANPDLRSPIGQPGKEVFPQWAYLAERFGDMADSEVEIQVETPDGPRDVRLTIDRLHNRRGQLIGRAVVTRDISRRKRAERTAVARSRELEAANRELEAANQQLRELSQVKDAFVSNVSHELRTPLTTLRLRYELLLRKIPAEHQPTLEAVRREIDRLEHLIEGLLLLSRLDREQVRLEPVPTDLNALAAQLVEDRQPLASERGLRLSFEGERDAPQVKADPAMIGEVLDILLTNGLAYTPRGGAVMVRVLTATDGRAGAGVAVADTGPGIPPDEQASLFERFQRGRAAKQSRLPGTGLGLAIAREIIDRHGGRIALHSSGQPGEGAAFEVWLPGA